MILSTRRTPRARNSPQGTTLVESWGADPAGSDQMYSILDTIAKPLLDPGTPPGYGLAGSVEQTDTTLWASPQAFTATAGSVAHVTFQEQGGGVPVQYDADTDFDFDVATIPDQVT